MNGKGAKILTITLGSIGVLLILAGVIIPLFLEFMTNRAIQDIWFKPENYDTWGNVPGKDNNVVIRTYKLYDYKNTTDKLMRKGVQFPLEVMEVPAGSYQEISMYKDWYYTNEAGDNFGQDVPSEFIAYHYNLTFEKVDLEPIDYNAKVTNVNLLVMGFFYSLGRAPVVTYIVPQLLDATKVLENDLIDVIIAYTINQLYFADEDFIYEYVFSLNLPLADVIAVLSDSSYGWLYDDWKKIKIWVQAVRELMASQTYDGAAEALKNHFQNDSIDALIGPSSLLYQLVESVLADMKDRYGTIDPKELARLQWGKCIVTLDLPLNLGSITPDEVYGPSYLVINGTSTAFVPEAHSIALSQNKINVDFSAFYDTILEFYPKYPKPGGSFLNLNTLGAFLILANNSDFVTIQEQFGFNQEQAIGLLTFTGQMFQLKSPDPDIDADGYSYMLARWANHIILEETLKLRSDVVWGLPASMLLCEWSSLNKTCGDFLAENGIANSTEICTGSIGWDIADFPSWDSLKTWVEAANKDSTAQSYAILLDKTKLDSASLDTVLSSIRDATSGYWKTIHDQYGCLSDRCKYDELFFKQWSTSEITMNPPPELASCVTNSTSFADWSPKYTQKIEWVPYSDYEMLPLLAPQIISYDSFLSPSLTAAFMNTYFRFGPTQTAAAFSLASAELVEELINYFLGVIPGFEFYSTHTIDEWIEGYLDPFLVYIGRTLIIENGGYPLAGGAAFVTQVGGTNEPPDYPYTEIYSGLNDPEKITSYYKYLGETYISGYGAQYDPDSPFGTTYRRSKVWDKNITFAGGEGGAFGIYVNKEDILGVYIAALKRNGNLTYSESVNYKGIDCYKFVIDQDLLKTAADVPYNIDWNQYPEGFNGFMNASSQSPLPTFVSLPRCLYCDEDAMKMVDYYAYDPENPFSTQIFPDVDSGTSYGTVEPLSGAGVQSVIRLQTHVGVKSDPFFNVTETKPDAGLYFPQSILQRNINYTQSQIDDKFSALGLAEDLRKYTFYFCLSFGSFFVLMALLVVAFRVRKNRFGGWKSRGASNEYKRAVSGEFKTEP